MKAFYEHRTYSNKMQIYTDVIQNLHFAAHWHSDIELLYVLEGSIGIGSNMQYRVINSGDLSVCSSNDIHYYKSEGMRSKILLVIFKPEVLDPLWVTGEKTNPYSTIFDDGSKTEFRSNLRDIAIAMTSKEQFNDIAGQQFLKLRLLELFLVIFRYFPNYYMDSLNRTPTYSSVKPIQIALKYIEDNYVQDISLDVISEKANLSPYYFSRLFKKTTGTNFKSYLNQIRINKAAEMISSTQKRILDIAYETGFTSIRTFNRAFINMRGYAPSLLRK